MRVTRRPDGSLAAGRTLTGRGAWVCAGSPECLRRALAGDRLERALRAPVGAEAKEALRAAFEDRQ